MNITQNLQDYWSQVKELAAQLPPVVLLVSIEAKYNKEHVAGRYCHIKGWYAAQHLLNGTHRIATKDESDAYDEQTRAEIEAAKQAVIDSKSIHIHTGVPEPKKGK